MRKAHFIYTEGITRYAPKGKSFIQSSISFEEPLTLEEFDKFNKCMYISSEDLQQRIDKALKFIDSMFDDGNGDKVIDNLLKLEKILEGVDSND